MAAEVEWKIKISGFFFRTLAVVEFISEKNYKLLFYKAQIENITQVYLRI